MELSTSRCHHGVRYLFDNVPKTANISFSASPPPSAHIRTVAIHYKPSSHMQSFSAPVGSTDDLERYSRPCLPRSIIVRILDQLGGCGWQILDNYEELRRKEVRLSYTRRELRIIVNYCFRLSRSGIGLSLLDIYGPLQNVY